MRYSSRPLNPPFASTPAYGTSSYPKPIAAFKSHHTPRSDSELRDSGPIAAAYSTDQAQTGQPTLPGPTRSAPAPNPVDTGGTDDASATSKHPLSDWIQEPRTHLLFNPTPFSVPPRTERTLLLRAPSSLTDPQGATVVVRPLAAKHNIHLNVMVAWSICHPQQTEGSPAWWVPVRVLNPNPRQPAHVPALSPLAELHRRH